MLESCSLQVEEHESREQAEQAPAGPFEDVEQMVDEALALPPAGEFKIPVSPFFTTFEGTQEITENYAGG